MHPRLRRPDPPACKNTRMKLADLAQDTTLASATSELKLGTRWHGIAPLPAQQTNEPVMLLAGARGAQWSLRRRLVEAAPRHVLLPPSVHHAQRPRRPQNCGRHAGSHRRLVPEVERKHPVGCRGCCCSRRGSQRSVVLMYSWMDERAMCSCSAQFDEA